MTENADNLSERSGVVNRAADAMPCASARSRQMGLRLVLLVLAILVVAVADAAAATWSRTYIRQLPDSAFAVVERSPEGKSIRRLPHHDAAGAVDLPHLCNAVARLPQVKWRDPPNAEVARQHLREHVNQVGPSACRPLPRSPK
jgi:hypothetical protein